MSVTLDEAIRALPEILERLERIETQNVELKTLIEANASGFVKPLYDVDGLRALGIGRDHAYKILRSLGTKLEGRLVVTNTQLTKYFSRGDE